MTLEQLHARGFDTSVRYVDDDGNQVTLVACGQCHAVCINGVPCHEAGCPNAARAKRETYEELNEVEE